MPTDDESFPAVVNTDSSLTSGTLGTMCARLRKIVKLQLVVVVGSSGPREVGLYLMMRDPSANDSPSCSF